MLRESVAAYEAGSPTPWAGDLPEEYRDRMIKGIVAFEMPITRIEGKFKLGQNRSAEDQQGMYDVLAQSADPDDQAVARLMITECNVTPRA